MSAQDVPERTPPTKWTSEIDHRPSGWTRISSILCDLCHKPAVWKHAAGGRRCAKCPRPEK